jgi:hypothetical protein
MASSPDAIRLDSLVWWLIFWTFVVVLGLVLEASHDFKRPFRQIIDWPTLRIRWTLSWLALVAALGTLGVAIGVGGELYVEWQAGRTEHSFRQTTDETIARLKKEAEDARLQQEKLKSQNLALWESIKPRHITIRLGAVTLVGINRMRLDTQIIPINNLEPALSRYSTTSRRSGVYPSRAR